MGLTPSELDELQTAVRLLETPGLATKISSFVGTPLEAGLKKLPESWHGTISTATRKSIEKALDVALLTLDRKERTAPANLLHKVAVGVSGAAGGTFGLAALAVELPVSTTIMLRSIADIARSQGEDLGCAEAACSASRCWPSVVRPLVTTVRRPAISRHGQPSPKRSPMPPPI